MNSEAVYSPERSKELLHSRNVLAARVIGAARTVIEQVQANTPNIDTSFLESCIANYDAANDAYGQELSK